ncbi:hypothetical protein, partial [Streptococcus pyogenes]|uniref:hypothetical protein n=1 Tax=Streptococcus pyogenes TaxID=1314 RepID=UPI001652BC51
MVMLKGNEGKKRKRKKFGQRREKKRKKRKREGKREGGGKRERGKKGKERGGEGEGKNNNSKKIARRKIKGTRGEKMLVSKSFNKRARRKKSR